MNSVIAIVLAASTLNWVGIANVHMGKNSADALYQRYFKTEIECRSYQRVRLCIPVPELPQEYFDNQNRNDESVRLNNPNRRTEYDRKCATDLRGQKLSYKEFYDKVDECKQNFK